MARALSRMLGRMQKLHRRGIERASFHFFYFVTFAALAMSSIES